MAVDPVKLLDWKSLMKLFALMKLVLLSLFKLKTENNQDLRKNIHLSKNCIKIMARKE